MLQAWQPLWQRQLHTRYGWQKVSGPLSALIQYLQDLGVDGQEPLCWKWAGHTLDIAIEDPCLLGKVRAFLAQVVAAWRTKRFSQAQSASGAEDGVDWTVARRLLRADKLPARRSSYKMVFRDCPFVSGVANGTLRSTCCTTARNFQALNPRLNGCWIIAPRSRMIAYGNEGCCLSDTSKAQQSMLYFEMASLLKKSRHGADLCTRRMPQEGVTPKTPGYGTLAGRSLRPFTGRKG